MIPCERLATGSDPTVQRRTGVLGHSHGLKRRGEGAPPAGPARPRGGPGVCRGPADHHPWGAETRSSRCGAWPMHGRRGSSAHGCVCLRGRIGRRRRSAEGHSTTITK
jgi:hypothetical protein